MRDTTFREKVRPAHLKTAFSPLSRLQGELFRALGIEQEVLTKVVCADILGRRRRGLARLRDGAWLRRPWAAAEPKGLAAAAVGGGGAWPGFEIDLGAVRLACGDLAGGPPPTGTSSSPAPQQDPTTLGTPATHYHHPQTPPTDATHGRIKQPGPTDTRHQTRAENTSGATTTDTTKRAGTSRFRPALDAQ